MRKKQPERTPLPPKPFTARSLVGMTQGARKRRAWREYLAWCRKNLDRELLKSATIDTWNEQGLEEGYQRGLQAQHDVRAKYLIGERLRPCLGCCACWGHRISTAYGEYAECSGPQTNGKRKSQIKAMRKWQESLSDDCDGSGVLPARKRR